MPFFQAAAVLDWGVGEYAIQHALLEREGYHRRVGRVKLSYKMLRQAVQDAWDAVGWQTLEGLLCSMPRRCEAVIAANGMYTKF